ncbi:hypothetical protein HDU76_012448 [Blyttiomyces sp. JEL0837]|nr:hypothetical protein HDU76_012448 [Blyttiomyces sp. JEL0837]
MQSHNRNDSVRPGDRASSSSAFARPFPIQPPLPSFGNARRAFTNADSHHHRVIPPNAINSSHLTSLIEANQLNHANDDDYELVVLVLGRNGAQVYESGEHRGNNVQGLQSEHESMNRFQEVDTCDAEPLEQSSSPPQEEHQIHHLSQEDYIANHSLEEEIEENEEHEDDFYSEMPQRNCRQGTPINSVNSVEAGNGTGTGGRMLPTPLPENGPRQQQQSQHQHQSSSFMSFNGFRTPFARTPQSAYGRSHSRVPVSARVPGQKRRYEESVGYDMQGGESPEEPLRRHQKHDNDQQFVNSEFGSAGGSSSTSRAQFRSDSPGEATTPLTTDQISYIESGSPKINGNRDSPDNLYDCYQHHPHQTGYSTNHPLSICDAYTQTTELVPLAAAESVNQAAIAKLEARIAVLESELAASATEMERLRGKLEYSQAMRESLLCRLAFPDERRDRENANGQSENPLKVMRESSVQMVNTINAATESIEAGFKKAFQECSLGFTKLQELKDMAGSLGRMFSVDP